MNGNRDNRNGGNGSNGRSGGGEPKKPYVNKIYVSAPRTVVHRDRARGIRDTLRSCGYDVTSAWLDEIHWDSEIRSVDKDAKLQERRKELTYADILVLITDESEFADGVHLVEFGDFLSYNRPVIWSTESGGGNLYGSRFQVMQVSQDNQIPMTLDMARKLRQWKMAGVYEERKKHEPAERGADSRDARDMRDTREESYPREWDERG